MLRFGLRDSSIKKKKVSTNVWVFKIKQQVVVNNTVILISFLDIFFV